MDAKRASFSGSQPNEWQRDVYTGKCSRESGCAWLLTPHRFPQTAAPWGQCPAHTAELRCLSVQQTHRLLYVCCTRLGVGARCRNASVKLERRRDWAVSGASFQNKCQFERWRLSSVSVLYVIKCSRNATFISGLLGIPKLLFTLCLCEFDLKI